MSFISCKSTEVVTIRYYIPEINFPEFPKLPECEIVEDGVLIKDENYFRQLLVFKESYKDTILKYNEKKNKLEEKK